MATLVRYIVKLLKNCFGKIEQKLKIHKNIKHDTSIYSTESKSELVIAENIVISYRRVILISNGFKGVSMNCFG